MSFPSRDGFQALLSAAGFTASWMLDADLDAAMARYNQVLDMSRDDLKALLIKAQLRDYEHKLTQLDCEDISRATW